MNKKQKKIIFLIRSFSDKTHFAYHLETVKYLSEVADIALIIERATGTPIGLPENVTVYQKWSTFLPLRVIQMMLRFIQLRMCGYNIFYIHYSFMGAILSGLVARLSGGHSFYWNAGMPWEYTQSRLRRFMEWCGYQSAQTLITASPSLVAGYSKAYRLSKERIIVVPNWIDVTRIEKMVGKFDKNSERVRLGIGPNTRTALYARRLGKPWGAQFLPEIFSKLPTDVHLLIAGEGPLRDELEADFVQRGLMKRVTFLGAIPQEELYGLLATADVFLFPSHSEGLAHGLLEALAAGCLPVVFAVGGNVPLIEQQLSSLLVPPHNTVLFAEKVTEVLDYDTDTRGALLVNMHNVAMSYDKEKVLPKLSETLFRSIPMKSI